MSPGQGFSLLRHLLLVPLVFCTSCVWISAEDYGARLRALKDGDTSADGDSRGDADADTDADVDTDHTGDSGDTDEPEDLDGDGWTRRGGDCWDDPSSIPDAFLVVSSTLTDASGASLDWRQPLAAEVYPGALDPHYDGVDQDCAGDNDFDADLDGFGTAFYPDAEGDFGSDCDDANAGTWPGAPEICGDSVLNDCEDDGTAAADVCFTGEIPLSSASLVLRGLAMGDQAGYSSRGAGDVDGDGLDDIILGAGAADTSALNAGEAYLLCDSASMVPDLGHATATLTGENEGDSAGLEVAGAGDMDGDGLDDILVAALRNAAAATDAGAVYLLMGPLTGTLSLDSAPVKLTGESDYHYAGHRLSAAGDTDLDGQDDILVGAYGDDAGGEGAGATYLILGPVGTSASLAGADAKIVGEESYDFSGCAVAGAGDYDADGYEDLVIGAAGNHAAGSTAGAAYVLPGPVLGTVDLDTASTRFTGAAPGDQAGYAVSGGGDINGDGYSDVLIGAWLNDSGGADSGAVYLLSGPLGGRLSLSAASARLDGAVAGDHVGYGVASSGDGDGDGFADLLIGAPNHDSGSSDAGATYLVRGPVTGSLSLSKANATLVGEDLADQAGIFPAWAGDVDGDGLDDIVTGAWLNDTAGTDAGSFYLLRPGDWR